MAGIAAIAVRKHFPESDETQKGHMKRQRQGLRSTRKLQTTMGDDEDHTIPNPGESTAPKPRKMQDMYIKIHNASETMHTNQPGGFPEHRATKISISWY